MPYCWRSKLQLHDDDSGGGRRWRRFHRSWCHDWSSTHSDSKYISNSPPKVSFSLYISCRLWDHSETNNILKTSFRQLYYPKDRGNSSEQVAEHTRQWARKKYRGYPKYRTVRRFLDSVCLHVWFSLCSISRRGRLGMSKFSLYFFHTQI